MGIFDRAKDRIERDNSGGWDRNYKKYVRKSKLDRIFEIPLKEKCLSLSYRRYNFPAFVIKNVNYQIGFDMSSDEFKNGSLPQNHTLFGLRSLAILYNLDIGLLLEVDSIKDWENLDPNNREFTLSFSLIAYRYRRFRPAYNHGAGISSESIPPRLTYISRRGIFEETPVFMKVKKEKIYLSPETDWPDKFYLPIQGLSIKDLGFGFDWQDEAAYTG